MTQQERFEAWATSQGINITDNGFGGYDSQWTEGALAGWEAAQAQAAAPAYNRDAVVVNLMRLANIDKHLARDIADAAKFAEVIEQIREEGEREHDECMEKFGTLDCPHCGGSGHIGDVQAAVEPVGKVLEVAADGSFQTGFFEELPVGTLLYTSPPDDLKFRPDWSGVDVLGEELHEAQKAMRLALKALQGVLKANRITQSRGLPDTYAEADRIRSQIISAVSVAEAAIAALEGALK